MDASCAFSNEGMDCAMRRLWLDASKSARAENHGAEGWSTIELLTRYRFSTWNLAAQEGHKARRCFCRAAGTHAGSGTMR
jgi:hypothetical protein